MRGLPIPINWQKSVKSETVRCCYVMTHSCHVSRLFFQWIRMRDTMTCSFLFVSFQDFQVCLYGWFG